jgi:hypothetical protein
MKRTSLTRREGLRRTPMKRSRTPLKRGRWSRESSELWEALEAAGIEHDKGIHERYRHDEEREAEEWHRVYGSIERVIWVKRGGRCDVPGCCRTECDNAHIETEGTGRKAHHSRISRLCSGHAGHRAELHRVGRRTFEAAYPPLDLEKCAAWIDHMWTEIGEEWVAAEFGDPDPHGPPSTYYNGDPRDRGYYP